MNKIKCFDIASEVIDEANKRFFPSWEINNDDYNLFKKHCDAIDTISDTIGCVSISISVDEITMLITLSIECSSIFSEKKDDVIRGLIKSSTKVKFSSGEDGNLIVDFVFPSLWSHT